MKLDHYLRTKDITEDAFAADVGCSQGTINKLRKGKANPTMGLLEAIRRASNGAVTPNDFIPEQEAGLCARTFPSEGHRDKAQGDREAVSVEPDNGAPALAPQTIAAE